MGCYGGTTVFRNMCNQVDWTSGLVCETISNDLNDP